MPPENNGRGEHHLREHDLLVRFADSMEENGKVAATVVGILVGVALLLGAKGCSEHTHSPENETPPVPLVQ